MRKNYNYRKHSDIFHHRCVFTCTNQNLVSFHVLVGASSVVGVVGWFLLNLEQTHMCGLLIGEPVQFVQTFMGFMVFLQRLDEF